MRWIGRSARVRIGSGVPPAMQRALARVALTTWLHRFDGRIGDPTNVV
jgi:hypothetical protein